MAANLLDFMKIFEPNQLTSMHLVMGTNALGIKKYVAAFTHAMLWQQYIEKNNFPKKDPELFRSENLFVKDRTCLLETTLYGAAGLLQHKAVATEPAMITQLIEYEKMLEELREAASIYISRYMNTRTHAGTDYNILRMYEAWCFKTRKVPSVGGVSYTIDNESIKGRFITEMTLMAGTTHHNKHRLSLINMRRHAQPALDHLAAFQGYHTVKPSKSVPQVQALRRIQQNGNKAFIMSTNMDIGSKARATTRTLDPDQLNRFFHTLNNFQKQIRCQINHHLIILSECQAIFKVMLTTGMRADHLYKTFLTSMYLKRVQPKVGATPVIAVGLDIPLAKMTDDHNVFYLLDHKDPERCAIFGLGCHFIVMCLTKIIVPGVWNIIDCLMGELDKVAAFQSTANRDSVLEACAYWAYRLFNNPYTSNRDFNESTVRQYLEEFLKVADICTAAKMHLPRDTVAQLIFEMYTSHRDHIHVRSFLHQNHDTMSHVYAQGSVMLETFLLNGWTSNEDFLMLDCAEAAQLPKLHGEFNEQLKSVPEELLDVLVDLIFPNIKDLIKRAEASYKHEFTPECSLYNVLTTVNHCIRRALQRLTTLGGPTCTWNIPAITFLYALQFFDRPEWVAFNAAMRETVQNNTNVCTAAMFAEAKSRKENYPEFEQRARHLNDASKAAMDGLMASSEEAMRVQARIKAGLHFAPVDKPLPVVKVPQAVGAATASTFYEDWCAKDPNDPELPSMSEYATGRVRIKWQEEFGMTASGAKAYKRNFSMLKTSAVYLDAVANVKGYTSGDLCARIDSLAATLKQPPATFLKELFYKLVSRSKAELIDPAHMAAFEAAGIPFPPGKGALVGKRPGAMALDLD